MKAKSEFKIETTKGTIRKSYTVSAKIGEKEIRRENLKTRREIFAAVSTIREIAEVTGVEFSYRILKTVSKEIKFVPNS